MCATMTRENQMNQQPARADSRAGKEASVRRMIPPILGFLLLSGITLTLFALGALQGFAETLHAGLLMSLIAIGLIAGIWHGWRELFDSKPQPRLWTRRNVADAASVVAGTLITYVLSVHVGLGAVVASALGGVAIALVLPSVAVPFYCGTFVGMISPGLVVGWPALVLAGLIGGIVYVIGKGALDGYGGKLGTTAFFACLATALVCQRATLSVDVPGMSTIALAILYSAIAAAATWALSIRLEHGAVLASGAIGLLGGLVLPAVHPETGGLYALAVFSASFAGMCSKQRMPNEVPLAIAGACCGAVVAITGPYMGGAGGKLGTIAFGSSIAVSGWRSIGALVQAPRPAQTAGADLQRLRPRGQDR